jgi:L-ascorbate metabolism protein UlaG (beta-lactamase superfamily)
VTIFDPRVLGAAPAGLRRERIAASPRFSNGRLENTVPVREPLQNVRLGDRARIMRDFAFGGRARTPSGPLPITSPLEAWRHAPTSGFRATWLGHSTVLLEMDGVRVLTDPVWGDRVSPFGWAGPRRFHAAPVALEALPALDAVVISHDHYDHLDYPTIRALARRDVPFYTSLGVGAHLEAWGVAPSRIVELDWWEEAVLPRKDLVVTAAPSRHFSGRGSSTNVTAWSSFVLRSQNRRVFFSGDTGLTPEYEEIGRRLGPFDLVMLEVGAYHPAWGDIHLGPDNALVALEMLGNGILLPVHWGTFDLALHKWEEPAEVLAARAPEQGIRLVMPRVGAALEPTLSDGRVDPWWREVTGAAHGSIQAGHVSSEGELPGRA